MNIDSSLEVCNLVLVIYYMVNIKIKFVGGMYYSNIVDIDFEICYIGRFFSEMLLVYWDCDILKLWYIMYVIVDNDYCIWNN